MVILLFAGKVSNACLVNQKS